MIDDGHGQSLSLIDWKTNEIHVVKMYHYQEWPDGGDPKDPFTLFDMIHRLKNMNPYCTVIHGSTGAGRTGTFIALLYLMNHIHSGAEYLNVFNTVLELRKDRKNMVRKAA